MAKHAPYDTRLDSLVRERARRLVKALTQVVRGQITEEVRRAREGRAPLRAKRRRILPCIAPGCRRPSKGPRFHYLCDEHRGAPKRDYEAWRQAYAKERAKAARANRSARRSSAARILPCIAPGCSEPSKGPRFHYLCEKHMGAPRKDYEAWRKAKRQGAKPDRR